MVYFRIGWLPDPGDCARLRAILSELRGGADVSPKEPGLSCDFVVKNWSDLSSQFLTEFVTMSGRSP